MIGSTRAPALAEFLEDPAHAPHHPLGAALGARSLILRYGAPASHPDVLPPCLHHRRHSPYRVVQRYSFNISMRYVGTMSPLFMIPSANAFASSRSSKIGFAYMEPAKGLLSIFVRAC